MSKNIKKPIVAKNCYGHLGDLLFERLIELKWFKKEKGIYEITEKGCKEFRQIRC